MTVALDTMVLIWGLQKVRPKRPHSRQDVAEMQRRAAILLEALSDKKETIVIPTIAVAELLLGIEPQDHGPFLAELQQRFFCPPFDVRASALAAKLWQIHRGLPKDQQMNRTV